MKRCCAASPASLRTRRKVPSLTGRNALYTQVETEFVGPYTPVTLLWTVDQETAENTHRHSTGALEMARQCVATTGAGKTTTLCYQCCGAC